MKTIVKLSLVLVITVGSVAFVSQALAKEDIRPSKPVIKLAPTRTTNTTTRTTVKSAEYNLDKDMTIAGKPVVPQEQAAKFIKHYAPDAKLNTSVEKIVEYYYKEADKEGIRGDVALAQALVETGFFKYGSTVDYKQNNFCGLGTTSKTVKGASFPTPQIGVRAHIQHLLVYSSKKMPSETVVDPRFDLVRGSSRHYATSKTWMDLSGRWAMAPGYGEKILSVHARMMAHEAENYKNNTDKKHEDKKKKNVKTEARKKTLQERIDDILRGA